MLARKYQAFPGDRYISDLKKAAKSSRSWIGALRIAILISAVADLYIMWDLVCLALDETKPVDLIPSLLSGGTEHLLAGGTTFFITLSLVLSYLFIGHLVGKKAREYKEFRNASSLVVTIVASLVEALALVCIAFFRLVCKVLEAGLSGGSGMSSGAFSEFSDASASAGLGWEVFTPAGFADFLAGGVSDNVLVDAAIDAAVLAAIMFLGAFLSMVVAYYKGDPIAGRTLRSAQANLHNDSRAYWLAYYRAAADPAKEREYEAAERRLDREAVGVLFSLSSLASQLNGILDPADAREFRSASSLAIDHCCASTTTEGGFVS
ncbi:hypothetical protein [Adlercreutzia aquisgranensis]|uniref:hypothetical protein n=1 Tax=Adlercreutzia aquisgranensis TaxID=2941323 RepID=UPI00203A75C4|nr:hypothetical protein [Adlercreutzia aquisgranensis]